LVQAGSPSKLLHTEKIMTDKHTSQGPAAVELDVGEHLWCTCGGSSTFPLCDRAAHKGTGNIPHKFQVTEKKTCYVCTCGKTGNKPFCDGSHKGG